MFDEILGKLTANLKDRMTNTLTGGNGLAAQRITSEEAARLAKEVQSAEAAVEPTVQAYESMSRLAIAESQMFIAGVKNIAVEASAYVDNVEAVVDTAEVVVEKAQKAAMLVQRYQMSKQRFSEDTDSLVGEFTAMMSAGNPRRAIESSAPSNEKRFLPSR